MKKSWASPLTTCYEIKVSRSDFLGDTKWPSYLPYCNELFFVCPPKMISIDEVPENAGLMYISSTGTRIYTKKKAPYREVEIPEDIWRYILMWRTVVSREKSYERATKKEYWEKWLEQREIDQYFGRSLGKVLRKTINTKIIEVQQTNKKLEDRLDRYDYLIEYLEEMGIDPKDSSLRWEVRNKLENLQNLVPKKVRWDIKCVRDKLTGMLEKIEAYEKTQKEKLSEKTQ